MGSHYQRKRRDGTLGGNWWVQYYQNGKRIRESTGTRKETEAKRFLKEREGRVAMGQPVLPRIDRIRYDAISNDLWEHYVTSGNRGLREAGARFKPLNQFFQNRRVAAITASETTKYIAWRQAQGVANGTINRELSVLGTMLRLAYERGKVLRLPTIHLLKEASPRSGFFERDQFLAVRRHLPEALQVAITVSYTFGWRTSEVLTLERRHVNVSEGTIRLDPGTTKSGEGRLVYLTPELKPLLEEQLKRVDELGWKLGRIVLFLFPHLTGQYQGRRIRDFRKAWYMACRKAGCAGMIRHDFRRTAVRNMINSGIPERVAMQITGHRTRSVFDRYHIVSPSDLQNASLKIHGHIHGHNASMPIDSSSVSMRFSK
jgi:integrase